MSEWLNIRQAAKFTGVSRQTIYNWIKEGKLFTLNFGTTSHFISINSLIPYIVKHCSNCFYWTDSHCSCREFDDVRSGCPDWQVNNAVK